MNNPFKAGDKVKCICDAEAGDKLNTCHLYTILKTDRGMVELEEAPNYYFKYNRFASINNDIEYNDDLASKIGLDLAKFFNCKIDSEHKDRWITPVGTKTNKGLALTVLRIIRNEY